jgi:hypothetical protein
MEKNSAYFVVKQESTDDLMLEEWKSIRCWVSEARQKTDIEQIRCQFSTVLFQ